MSEKYKFTIMKELSIKEKARRYDEAIEIAKDINNEQRAQPFNVMTRVFPELAESEDERIRKALIEYFNEQCDMSDWNGVYGYQVVAWLEKQGEQKSEEVDNLHNYLYGEQESSWSEEDDRMCAAIIFTLAGFMGNEDKIDWLKSLKSKIQPNQEWNEEDKKVIRCLEYTVRHFYENEDTIKWCCDWLKSLRPQKQDVMSVDEFRHIVGYLVQDIVANEHMAETEKQPTNFFVEKYYNKLRSQSHWEPSDAQMWALSTLANIPESASDTCKKTAQELLEQLKKLREE